MAAHLVEEIESAQDFLTMVQSEPGLIVVDVFTTWCGPCKMIAPKVEAMAADFPSVRFVKVDAEKHRQIAQHFKATGYPCFVLLKQTTEVDRVLGAREDELRSSIEKHAGTSSSSSSSSSSDLIGELGLSSAFAVLDNAVDKSQVYCLNENDEDGRVAANVLRDGDASCLESDVDEQLLLHVPFLEMVKGIHSLKIVAPDDGRAPKTVQLFVNQRNLDFDSAEDAQPIQTLTLAEPVTFVELEFVRFQNVHTLSLFVVDNQGDTETTAIQRLYIIGRPAASMDMSSYKRVSGKKGEAHE
jgi:thioredoxin